MIRRYRGKKRPDAILGEICWWSQKIHDEEKEEDFEDEDRQETEEEVDDDDIDDDGEEGEEEERDLVYGFEQSDASDYDGEDENDPMDGKV